MNFTKLKAMIGDVAAQKKQNEQEREKLIQRRQELELLPINKGDLLAWFEGVFDGMTEEYQKRLQQQLDESVFKSSALSLPQTTPLLSPWSGQPANTVYAYAIVALLGDEIRKRLPAIINDLKMPDNAGPPIEERKKEIAAINTKVTKLNKQLEELDSAARSAGISLD